MKRNGKIWKMASCCLVAVTLTAMAIAAPQTGNNQSQSLEDLGTELLDADGLGELLAPTADHKPSRNRPDLLPSVDLPSVDLPSVDEMRRLLDPSRPSPAGEDLGQQKESPLALIAGDMQRAGHLLALQDFTDATRSAQDAIVTELDKLIDKLHQQCQNCSGGKCDKPPKKQRSQASTPKPGAGKPSAGSGSSSKPVASQVLQGRGSEAKPGDPANADTVKKLWGQLPERLRQQLLQSSADEFLPKYRKEIEAYFQRLAESQRDEP